MARVIWLHPDAPPKPALGEPCNGCGLCCLAEPCPIGMVVSLKRRGACRALEWSDDQGRYLCGMLAHPSRYLGLPTFHPEGWLNRWLRRWSRRSIAAGVGCDADLEALGAKRDRSDAGSGDCGDDTDFGADGDGD